MATYQQIDQILEPRFNRKNSPFLFEMLNDWEERKPLKDIKIAQTLYNSYETLFKTRCLLAAGANVTAIHTSSAALLVKDDIKNALFKAGVTFISNPQDSHGAFDIGLDCGARIPKVPHIKVNKIVELTGTGSQWYRENTHGYTIIDIDNSRLKNLECINGTGEAFVRGFQQLTGKCLKNKFCVLFGYGKVGYGIVKFLSRETPNILIVEKDTVKIKSLRETGYQAIHLDELSSYKKEISNAFCTITATGIPNFLSHLNLSKEFFGNAYLTNMGGADEYGTNFSLDDVLFKKSPINFSLDEPTRMHYLDPVFYAHNLGAEIFNNIKTSGYHPFPKEMDLKIIEKWQKIHSEDISDIIN